MSDRDVGNSAAHGMMQFRNVVAGWTTVREELGGCAQCMRPFRNDFGPVAVIVSFCGEMAAYLQIAGPTPAARLFIAWLWERPGFPNGLAKLAVSEKRLM